jgi:hypothetical protein
MSQGKGQGREDVLEVVFMTPRGNAGSARNPVGLEGDAHWDGLGWQKVRGR